LDVIKPNDTNIRSLRAIFRARFCSYDSITRSFIGCGVKKGGATTICSTKKVVAKVTKVN
jgi:hypothetical protein